MTEEIAYLAGLFDGEGCVRTRDTGAVNVRTGLDCIFVGEYN